MWIERDLECTMRDGCVLRADRYRPDGDQELPTLLLRTPYDKRRCHYSVYAHPGWYARQGFNVVLQDVRGRFASDGDFDPFLQEGPDGFDAVEWAARLPGADGAVAMYGQSYSGYAQLATAAERPAHLVAIAPAVVSADPYGWFYEGGALRFAFAANWAATLGVHESARRGDDRGAASLSAALANSPSWLRPGAPAALEPVADTVPWYREWVTRGEPDDPYWKARDLSGRLASIDVPALLVGGWYDIFLDGTLAAFEALAGRDPAVGPTRLVLGPWSHGPWADLVGDADVGAATGFEGVAVDREQIAFFRHCLTPGGPAVGEPEIRYHVMFDGSGWRESVGWPPRPATASTLFLRGGGLANTATGDGRLSPTPPRSDPPDIYAYDPLTPVPAIGGHASAHADLAPLGAHDQRRRQQRPEVLVYTSAPVARRLVVAGDIELDLFVASTGASADFAARLSIVRTSGEALNVADGIARVGAELEGTAAREEPIRVRVSLRGAAFALAAGERLRLDVTGGAFPHFACNPQTGSAGARSDAPPTPQTHLLFHREDAPSALTLGVLEGGFVATEEGREGQMEAGRADKLGGRRHVQDDQTSREQS
ncbi:MAG: CocE/NonD family hydrolase [Actinobacteria bacterium]|nr:CocE/NonD family hydrolase [Actinomycetota bacterium]